MTEIAKISWSNFRDQILDLTVNRPQWPQQLLFRGHGKTSWKLASTLDRYLQTISDGDRSIVATGLLRQFQLEALQVAEQLPQGDALELLARHHGLPSPLLDWTTSPYIAAYFAFASSNPQQEEAIAIWVLERNSLPAEDTIELIDDPELLRFNERALTQRGVFLRVSTLEPIETLLDGGLKRFEFDVTQREHALQDLDQMTINSTYLFQDLNGAAETAMLRVHR